jgi:surfactin synthase thioesterase subunit
VTEEEAEAWREHTTGSFALHRFTGGHFFLNTHARSVIGLIAGHPALR